ncbi:NADH-quinone oxidoreductase subunit M [Carboxydochorda subterranea]|uniref:NADH-quinone oxidoreductase subunit M n=1 Tax=Carboxydichorda subterranea TaxID=3109565 RepID=A0ABZ1C0F9_9FIRM|nr:NADH-quinone oxidoreductase subunit M [Limnochorda sp. L945t]WRP18595.1 NADH-quinone oxidoreductase subunit M [Limnochorda sp. L945t]
MLSLLVFAPLIGSLVLVLMPKDDKPLLRRTALAFSLVPLAVVLVLWTRFDTTVQGMQFVERVPWIPSVGIQYFLGVDGISFPMLIVTALVTTLAILVSFSIEERVKDFMALMLLLETGMLGVFVSLDYFLFYIFWEVVLVPMYFIIGIWGGPRREYAAIKFFIYTLLGSVVMLVGILALYFQSGLGTFDMLEIAEKARLAPTAQYWIFLLLFFGFAVKVPVFPFHTWLPDAHVEAPTGGSMLLAGVLLKMGTYGFYRISYPTLPDAARAFAIVMGVLGVINIIYGALVAMAQKDLKKMVAYSSISHMGFVLLGLAAMTPMSMAGGLFVMISHGLISPMMFFYAGTVLYERTHTRMLDEMNALFTKMPIAATLMAFASFANLGLPGLSGFAGEFFTFVGTFPVLPALVYIGVLGMVLTAAYHLWMMQRILMGDASVHAAGHADAPAAHGAPSPSSHAAHAEAPALRLPDLRLREALVSAPLMALIVLFGVAPSVLLRLFNPSIQALLNRLGGL